MYFFRSAALLAFALPVAAQAPLHLIPMPREVTRKPDVPLASGVNVVCEACDPDDQFAATDLRDTLAARGIPVIASGLRIVLHRGGSDFSPAMKAEGYTVAVTPDAVTLTGATASGVFYAAQTAKQMIESDSPGHFVLRGADIRDWPAMQYRGLSDDLSRGPIDTLDFQKKLIRTLAAYKDNLYSPYFENTQQYVSNPLPAPPGGSISAADARELVAYSAKFHVMIVPDQEAFGHLRHSLVWEEYQPLAETPHGAVLAPGQPGSLVLIKQMFTELAALYPSPFLHVGADETVDLGKGQTKAEVDAQGLGKVYLNFMEQIDTTLQPLNRRLLFWADIAENSPELLKTVPESFKQNTIAISWHYTPSPNGYSKYLNYFRSSGFETWVAPGINNWSRVYPNYNYGLQNIQQFTRDGQHFGATGQLNTLWNDDGEALASNNWYGILFGCAAAWQPGESSIPQFQNNYAAAFHGDMTGKLNEAQQEIMAAHALLKGKAGIGDGSDLLFWDDPWAKDQQENAAMLRPYLHELRLHAEKALDLIAQVRAAYPAPANSPSRADGQSTINSSSRPEAASFAAGAERPLYPGSAAAPDGTTTLDPRYMLPSNPTTLREPDAIDALELGARRLDFIGLKFQLADEIAQGYAQAQAYSTSSDKQLRRQVSSQLSDINGVNGRIQDLKDGYSTLRELYAQMWLRTDRPSGLRQVLEHYDYTIATWLARMDKVRTAQRQWADTKTLPPAAEVGIPAPPIPPSPGTPLGPLVKPPTGPTH